MILGSDQFRPSNYAFYFVTVCSLPIIFILYLALNYIKTVLHAKQLRWAF